MRLLFAALAAAAMVTFSGAAQAAGPRAGSLGLNLHIGQDVPINGAMHTGADVSYADLGLLFPALAGQSGQAIIGSRSYDDFYGASPFYRIGATYGYNDNLELFISFSRTEGDSDLVQIGTLTTPLGGTAAPLFARFSDYRSNAFEVGGRVWLGERSNRLRTYAALRAGVAHTDAIAATFSAPDAGSGETIVPFYDDSTGFTGGVDFGVAYEVARLERLNASVEIGAEVGVRYVSTLDENDSVLGAVSTESLNNKSGRTSAPVLFTVRMRWGGS